MALVVGAILACLLYLDCMGGGSGKEEKRCEIDCGKGHLLIKGAGRVVGDCAEAGGRRGGGGRRTPRVIVPTGPPTRQ